MAENQENRSREDLTEEASPHRIEEYRNKGMVSQSRDVSSLAVLLATGVTLYTVSPKFGQQVMEFMREVFKTDLSARVDLAAPQIAKAYLMKALWIIASIGLPICCAGFICGALSSFIQIGAIFSTDPITPDLEKINPLQGLQKLLSTKLLIDGLRMIIKMAITLTFSYYLLKSEILISPAHMGAEPGYILANFARSGKSIFISLAVIFTIFAAVDYGFQKFEFDKNLRMTKQEAKQEYKEREGDPQIRARIRSVQREMARKRMMQAVKKADVIVTNPTHIAVALVYDTEKMSAPKVVAKGADFVAQKIKQVAAEAGVPMVENVPLARTLFKTVKIGQAIPRNLYQAVAEVLAYVYRLKKRNL